MKCLIPLLILISCHEIKVLGVLEWKVVGKVTDYGQNVTLFCNVPNCCPDDAGWDRWTPHQRTLFIDVKTGRPNKKYDGKVLKDGYTLIIQNLTQNDFNVSYSCLYGVTLGERKFLLEEDVFIYTKQRNDTTVISAGQIAGIVVGVVLVTVFVALFVFHMSRPKHCGTGGEEIAMDSIERDKVMTRITDGKEIRKYVRIHVIGKGGVGKTSLVHRLLGIDLKPDSSKSTDGIEIHKNCQIKTSNGEWVVGKETEKLAMIKRIKKIMQYGNMNTQETVIVDGQSYPPGEMVLEDQMHQKLYLSNKELSGRDDEKMHLLSKEQRHGEEVVVDVAVSRNTDELETKDAGSVSVAPHNNPEGNKINTTDPIGDSKDEPRTEKSVTEDEKHHEQEPPPIIMSPEIDTALNYEESEINLQELIAKMNEILLNAKEREKISEDLEGFVECGIWDFAGQKEYLGTHQTFFTPQAIYVLVADIQSALEDIKQENDFDSIGKYIDFWFDSIHCFCKKPSEGKLCPPVFMVFTGTDKNDEFDKPYPLHENTLLSFDDRKKDHIRGIYNISNTRMNEKDSKEIIRLKEDISKFAKEKDYFFEELPTEWIKLENALEAIKNVEDKLHVISLDKMKELAQTILIKETNKLDKFLTYQHKIGNIIFLENLKDYIILRPTWLVECFRCLIFDSEKRDFNLVSKSTWDDITSNGKLSMEIIDSLFEKESGINIEKFRQYLLKLLEQFDIIIIPKFEDTNQNLNPYYMPCVIEKSSLYESIKADFINENSNVRITPWLVLEFKFLPLAYFNHVFYYFINKYEVCKETSGHPAIYKGKLVFKIDEFRKCLICFSHKAISLQIWEWCTLVDERVYSSILNKLCNCIENLEGQFSQDISYSISAKCIKGDYREKNGRISIEKINEKDTYFCDEHKISHSKKDEDLEKTWLKHAIKREKKKHSEQKKKSTKEKKLQEDKIPIPGNRKDLIQKQIHDWEKKDKMFVSTRASDYVMERLQDNSCVTLTAPAGVGKSFIARHTALVLQKEGYNIIPVELPADIKTYYQPGKKTVFIVDDICGNFTASQQQIDCWKQLLPVIDRVIADKCCKIIVSCRLQVYKDDKFKILTPFKSCECNLISNELCLTSVEKTNIAKSYVGTNITNIDDLSFNCDFFPLLCSLYNEKEDVDVKEYFKNPFDVYKSELDRLSEYGDEGLYKICSLALCVLFNNDLKEKWFQGKITDEQGQIIKDICEACGINGIPKAKLKKALDTLDGTFICKQNGIYRTIHDKLFDFLAHYFGQSKIECFIEHGDSDLVHERFIWQKSPDENMTNIDFIIEIPDGLLELYLERCIKDWLSGKLSVVFSNNNMKASSFRQKLLKNLAQLKKSMQVSLANTKDTEIPRENSGSGTTPLILTCYHGYTDMVEWILLNDVVVDQCRDDGVSGLFMASQYGHTDIVKVLLERNSDADLCTKNGSCPLYIASQNGHTNIVKLLLEKNPNVDLRDNDGFSPSEIASQNGYTDIVRLLSR